MAAGNDVRDLSRYINIQAGVRWGGGGQREKRGNKTKTSKKNGLKKGNLGSVRNTGFHGGQRVQIGMVQKNQRMKCGIIGAGMVLIRFREQNSDIKSRLGKKLRQFRRTIERRVEEEFVISGFAYGLVLTIRNIGVSLQC
jgi:hypothetical protein